ncbi:MAG: helix-turn-helix transcriptional regulator, partial [Candidatus Gastranaerophilales bacterium]|nr:helix-turn-helix transcriptional regulator [Candidatus Gastranaerophilales bacterium]
VSLIETGNRFPRIDTLEKISKVFGITVNDLFDFTECDLNIEDMQNGIAKMIEAIKDDKIKTIALYNFLKNLINI